MNSSHTYCLLPGVPPSTMTPNSIPCDDALKSFGQSLSKDHLNSLDCSSASLDMLKRDRFELLSAYLDSEVTAAERRQVEEWLAHDPVTQCLYKRLLQLRSEMRSLPCTEATQPKDQLMEQVLARTCQRTRQLLAWSGVAAVLLITSVASFQLDDRSRPQMAESPSDRPDIASTSTQATTQGNQADNALRIALNHPVVNIPKAQSPLTDTMLKSGPMVEPGANLSGN